LVCGEFVCAFNDTPSHTHRGEAVCDECWKQVGQQVTSEINTNTTIEEIQSITKNMSKLDMEEWIQRQSNEILFLSIALKEENKELKEENDKLKELVGSIKKETDKAK